MYKRLGIFLAVLVLLAAFVPLWGNSMPTRAMEAEIIDVLLDGPVAEGGEFAEGTHAVSVLMNNTGDEHFMKFLDFYLNITYTSNDTVLLDEIVNKVIYIAQDSTATLKLADVDLPEGEFQIKVNTTIGTSDTDSEVIFKILNVVDLSITNMEFEEGATYPLNDQVEPKCTVTYEGNVQDFADTVTIYLQISTDEVDPEVIYNESMEILTPTSMQVAPGKEWIVLFPAWTPSASGSYKAIFSVDYDTYNLENNVDEVLFNIAEPPVIKGTVTANGMPVPGVDVTVSTDPVTKTTTDANGEYQFQTIPSGSYTIEFSKMWMSGNLTTVVVTQGQTLVVDATLELLDAGGLRGFVTLPNGSDAVGAIVVVEVTDSPPYTTTTNTDGFYEFEEVPSGNATVTASSSGYDDDIVETTIIRGTWNNLDLALKETPFNVSFSVPDEEPGFPIYDHIAVFFTRPIMKASIDSSTLTLRNMETGSIVTVIYSFADSDMTVVITPNPPLEYDTQYQIEVKPFIQDTNGHFFPSTIFSTFTTEFQILEVELVSFYPQDDQNEVPITAVITAVFPIAMDGDTINNDTFLLLAQGGAVVESVITYEPLTRTARLEPVSDLNWGTRYSVSLDSDILAVDPSWDFLGFTWSFETEVLVTTGSLVGKVLDEDGDPFEPSAVSIRLSATWTTKVLTKNPDINGRFEFLDVDEGLWTMAITVNGYKIFTSDYTITADDTYEIPDSIELEKEDTSDDNDIPWPIIGLIAIVILLIIVIIYYLLNRPREAPAEEERRPGFGRRREEPEYYGGAEEFEEGEFICPQCGYVVDEGDAICPNCGSEFEEGLFECPECGASIPANADTCPDCGAMFEGEGAQVESEGDYYEEDEDEDITGDYEVEDDDDDYGIPQVE
ncbi:MAG: carboxypeptidase regulatory-like domain-containing protein [Thermoplasmatota archaeon]